YLESVDVSSTPVGQPACSPTAPCVTFNSKPVHIQAYPHTFKVRTAAGVVAAPTTGAGAVPAAIFIVPHHGPLVKPVDAATLTTVSVRWTGQEGTTHDLRGIFGLNTAADVAGAMTALKDFSTGAQNFVLADDQGNIGYDPHALVPYRKYLATPNGDGMHFPWLPVTGDGTAEWGATPASCVGANAPTTPDCFLADQYLPQGMNPTKGYYFTANADPVGSSDSNNPLATTYLSYDWDDSSGFRATRIEQMIEATLADHGNVTLEDMQRMQSDHVSRPGAAFVPVLDKLAAAAGSAAPAQVTAGLQILDQWKANGYDCPTGLLGTDPKRSPVDPTTTVVQNSSGCFLFHEFLRTLATNVFTDDLAVVGQGVDGLAAVKAMLYMLTEVAPTNTAAQSFCNDVNAKGTTTATKTCAQQALTALATAYGTLSAQLGDPSSWVWGRVHTAQPVSLLALVTSGYAPGPYARPGGAFTVDVGNPSLGGAGLSFAYASGSAVRHISVMDPDMPVTKMQLPGPERDGPTGIPGPDLLGQYVQNQYFDFTLSNTIDANAVSTQSFQSP
ncbi:MAG TPA: penicillin acylase family protein, partial [Kofleriaceae bacterium]